jgi:choline-sulfatase
MTTALESYDHVVLISIDTLRSDALAHHPAKGWPGKYGLPDRVRPSALDRLLPHAAWFPTCVSAAPYTSASHASYLTGCWPYRHGVLELFHQRLRMPTVFAGARTGGYRTLMKVDFPLMIGERLGFTDDVDEYAVGDDEAALRFLATNRRTFSLVHFSGAHLPYGFSEPEHDGAEFARALADLENALPDKPPATYGGPVEATLSPHRRYLAAVERLYRRGAYRELFAAYLAGVDRFFRTRFDPFLRRLLATVEGGRYLLIVFGDHGEEYDEDSFAHQNSVSDGVLTVPLLFYGHGVRPGVHRNRVRSIDLVPTLEEVAPVAPGVSADGVSLATAIRDGTDLPARDAFAQSYVATNEAYARFLADKRGSRVGGTVPHTLMQEAAYVGPWRVVRRWARQEFRGGAWRIEPTEPATRLERMAAGSSWEEVSGAGGPQEAIDRLDTYHDAVETARQAPSARDTAIADDRLRDRLRTLGYHI